MWCECVCSPNQAMVSEFPGASKFPSDGQKFPPWAKGRPRRPFCANQPVAHLMLRPFSSIQLFPWRASTHCLPELLQWLLQCRHFALYTAADDQNLPDLRTSRRFTPSPGDWPRQLNNFANSKLRDDNFLEQRCWILQQWARECK